MKRTIKLAVAAFAVTTLAGPPAAHAGAAHLLGSYKVEKHIDIEGEDGTYTVSCPNNDIAIDGMWRIDNVDQDNDFVYDPAPTFPRNAASDVLNSLEPVAAYPDSPSVSKWLFKFVATSGGDVQGKLSLFCLPKRPTAVAGHSHDWLPSARKSSNVDEPSGDLVIPAPGANTYSNGVYTPTPGVSPTGSDCAPGEIAIQPGFEWRTPDSYGKPWMRYPTSTSLWRNYKWGFFTPTGGTVRLYWRCLPLLSDYNVPLGHRHKLVKTPKLTPTPVGALIKKNSVTEVQVICGDQYKAAIGVWDFGYTGYVWNVPANSYYKRLWYLGMDPRPKSRAFKILNTDSVDIAANPKFGALCFKTKTT